MRKTIKVIVFLTLFGLLMLIPPRTGGVAPSHKANSRFRNENNNEISNESIKKKKLENKEKNDDVIGYLTIPGTSVDYPIMQTKDNPDFYLDHDINKKYDFKGTPYLSAYCDLEKSDNLIIYGHNINGGRMFGELLKYKQKSFYDEHKYLYFDAKQEQQYEIFAVISVDVNAFTYWKFVMAIDEADFNKFVSKVKASSLYETEITPEYGEQLLTLSTCDNGRGKDYRFVVFAKPILNN